MDIFAELIRLAETRPSVFVVAVSFAMLNVMLGMLYLFWRLLNRTTKENLEYKSDMQESNDRYAELHTTLLDERESHQDDRHKHSDEMMSLRSDVYKLSSWYNEEKASLSDQISTLTKKIEDNKAASQKKIKYLEEKLNKVVKDLEDARLRADILEKQYEDTVVEKKDLQLVIADKQEDIIDKDKRIEVLTKKNNELSKRVDSLDELGERVNSFEAIHKQTERTLEMLREQIELIQKEIAALKGGDEKDSKS